MTQQILLQPEKTIVLVGLMGCGKSAIGKRLAKKIKLPFVDLDTKIEQEAKMPVKEIFEKYGEDYFRKLEVKIAKQVIGDNQVILATGGGAFINDEIRKLIKEKCISVWLKADLDILLKRVSRKRTRPLLENGDKKEILKNLMDKRYPIYEQADITTHTGNETHEVVLRRIMEAVARI